MKTYYLRYLLISLIAITACSSSDPGTKLVKDYLANSMEMDVSSIKITNISKPLPWTGSDSLDVLQADFDKQKTEVMDHLAKAKEAATKAIEAAEASKSGGFKLLEEIADETIATSQQTLTHAEILIAALSTDCKGTTLEEPYKRIQYFKSNKEDVLYYVINGTWMKKEDSEAKEFSLQADKEITTILQVFKRIIVYSFAH